MDRAHVELSPDGQLVVDVSHLYSWPKGERSQFNDPRAILLYEGERRMSIVLVVPFPQEIRGQKSVLVYGC